MYKYKVSIITPSLFDHLTATNIKEGFQRKLKTFSLSRFKEHHFGFNIF